MKRYKKLGENLTFTIEGILKNNNIDNVTYYSSSFPFGLVILYNPAKGKLKDLFPIKVFEYIVDTYLKPSNKAMKVNYIKDLMNEKEWSKKNEIYSNVKQVILISHNREIKIIKA